MWVKSFKKRYEGVTADQVLECWYDVNVWINWLLDTEYCRMEGEFKVGSTFLLRPKGAPEFKIRIADVNTEEGYTDMTSFFGAKMLGKHEVRDVDGGVEIKVTMTVTGLLTPLWVRLVAANVASTAEAESDSCINYVRNKNR